MIPEERRVRYIKKWLYTIAIVAFLFNTVLFVYIYTLYEPVTISGITFILTLLLVTDVLFLAFAMVTYSFLKKFF